jgi:VIT1/CCC1 family predicted Fe2+/Mn2+ transporter
VLTEETKKRLRQFQRNEITECHVYRRLADVQKQDENRRVFEQIAADEERHYQQWKRLTGDDVQPDWARMRMFIWISRLFGFTFAVKLMEQGEVNAQETYSGLTLTDVDVQAVIKDEGEHEKALLGMLDEERLRYVGSIVLGLNDALVELTGALAGLTLALQNTRLIALTGCITGIAAALSMASSEYLSTKAEAGAQSPLKAALYTGTAYVVTVVSLIMPYLVFSSYYLALACTLAIAVLIIALFNYYISVAKDQPFGKRFAEMAGMSLCVAGLSFLIGLALRKFMGVDV